MGGQGRREPPSGGREEQEKEARRYWFADIPAAHGALTPFHKCRRLPHIDPFSRAGCRRCIF